MPSYDFKGRGCGGQFEALGLKEAPACPGCQGQDLEQLLSLFRVDSANTRDSSMKEIKIRNDKARRDYKHDVAAAERDHHH